MCENIHEGKGKNEIKSKKILDLFSKKSEISKKFL